MSWVRTGTVAVTNGSAIVTGTGTAWANNNVQIGHAFNGPDGKAYEVTSVDSATQITLATPYLGSTATGQAYSVQPNQGFSQNAATILQGFLTQYGSYASTSLAGRFGDGTATAPGITFVGDQDTGATRLDNNRAALVAGGVAALTWSGSGVGAGTTSPVAKLHAYTAAAGDPATTGAGDPNMVARLQGQTVGLDIGVRTNGVCWLQPRLTYDSSVNFGMDLCPNGGILQVGGTFRPITDNAQILGDPGRRWSVIYAGSGSINTSDERIKQWRGGLTAAELAAAKEIAAIARKGADHARLHTGVRAQQVISIMTAHDLDPMCYGFVCHDSWAASPAVAAMAATDTEPGHPARDAVAAGDIYGVRYDELAMFLAAAEAQERVALQARIAALEARAA